MRTPWILLPLATLGACVTFGTDKDDDDDDTGDGIFEASCAEVQLGDDIGEALATGDTSSSTSNFESCSAGDDTSEEEPDGGGGEGGGSDGESPDTGASSPTPDTGGGSEGDVDYNADAPDVSLAWTAPKSGTYWFWTFGTEFDTVLSVYASSCEGEPLECDDDGGSDLDSLIELDVIEGQTYIIVLDGYDSYEVGTWVLSITDEDPGFGDDDGDNDTEVPPDDPEEEPEPV